jgi:hypothetical protein
MTRFPELICSKKDSLQFFGVEFNLDKFLIHTLRN